LRKKYLEKGIAEHHFARGDLGGEAEKILSREKLRTKKKACPQHQEQRGNLEPPGRQVRTETREGLLLLKGSQKGEQGEVRRAHGKRSKCLG